MKTSLRIPCSSVGEDCGQGAGCLVYNAEYCLTQEERESADVRVRTKLKATQFTFDAPLSGFLSGCSDGKCFSS